MEFYEYRNVYTRKQRQLIAEEFNRIKGQYYLDHAGATLYSERQLQNIFGELSKNLYGNPHAQNISSKLTTDAIDIVRFIVLSHFNTGPDEYSLVFTSGATAALKLIGEYFDFGVDGALAYLEDNHTSVLGMRQYAPHYRGFKRYDAFAATMEPAKNGNSLFIYPAQSNFSGTKYPLEWIEKTKLCDNWHVALDAASFVSTSRLDLRHYKPDFVAISFYKMFGYPTGLGALLIRNGSAHLLEKTYFGGGTVLMALADDNVMIPKTVLHEKFEDGTAPFLSIIAVRHGFETLQRLALTVDVISEHTFNLARYVYKGLTALQHSNGAKVAVIYHDTDFQDHARQGGIVNFNLRRANGTPIGYAEVLHLSNLFGIHLRTGCFCNPGACHAFLGLRPEDVHRQFDAGHVCGDDNDLVDGWPTGSVRVSFGYMSTREDADRLLDMIESCFVDKSIIHRQLGAAPPVAHAKRAPAGGGGGGLPLFGTLKQIFLYPIKSCGPFVVLHKWELTVTGLKYDRQWMIINAAGVALTQKNERKLCLIKPMIDHRRKRLTLTYPGASSVTVPLDALPAGSGEASGFLCQSKVCGDNVRCRDCGEEVAQWLVDVLHYPGLRLLKQSHESAEQRVNKTSKSDNEIQLSLANKAQFLLINLATVEWLQSKMQLDGLNDSLQSTILRFRPNFVVDFNKPFVENNLNNLSIDHIDFKSEGKCTRCQMICVNQLTAGYSKQPLQILAKEFKGNISFGVYLSRIEINLDNCIFVNCQVKGT